MRRRDLLRALGLGGVATALAGGSAGWYALDEEPGWLQVERVRVPVARLPRAFDGLTIAQISDLHLGPYVGAERVRAAVDVVLGLRPDVVALTGDHVSGLRNREVQTLAADVSRLATAHQVFAVLGNHDYWTNPVAISAALSETGATVLCNAARPLERAGEALYIAGVDDVWLGQDDLARTLAEVPADARAILLVHEPDFADQAAQDPRVALQLSGHSHGGQVRVPGVGPLRLPPLGQKYPAGLYRVGDCRLYTNRGIGVITPPVRFNCRPEVALLELVAL